MRQCLYAVVIVLALVTTSSFAATATFTPVGPTQVPAGTNVIFDVTVTVGTLSGFDAADVVIGASNAFDLSFAYSAQWTSAFSTVSNPSFDVGFYPQDVFVGGNNPTSVGTTKLLGTVTVDTTGLVDGVYQLRIDNATDSVSTLARAGSAEPLNGSVNFIVAAIPVPTAGTWGVVAMSLLVLTAGTLHIGGFSMGSQPE